MAFEKTFLTDLSCSNQKGTVEIRVVRLWVNKFDMIEFIALDEKGGLIECVVRSRFSHLFKGRLKEGNSYMMSRFNVGTNDGAIRATKHNYKINLMPSTIVREAEGLDIPRYHFDFVGADDIFGGLTDHTYLIDFMGLLKNIDQEVLLENKNKDTKGVDCETIRKCDFWLEDVNGHQIKATMWGEYSTIMTDLARGPLTFPIIIVLGGAKVNFYRDHFNLQNCWNKTALLINPNIDAVNDFKQRLLADSGDSSATISDISNYEVRSWKDEYLNPNTIKTVDYLNFEPEEGTYVVRAKIEGLQNSGPSNWFYDSCPRHSTAVQCLTNLDTDKTKVAIEYLCDACPEPRKDAIPRFRVQMIVADETGSVVLILFGDVVQKIIGMSCPQLIQIHERLNDVKTFPQQLLNLVGKTFLFKIEVKEWNLANRMGALTVKGCSENSGLMKDFDGVFSKLEVTLKSNDDEVTTSKPDGTLIDMEVESEIGSTSEATPTCKRTRSSCIVENEGLDDTFGRSTSKRIVKVKIEKDL